MASHAVVFLNNPPTFLDIVPRILRLVLVAGGKGSLLAAEQEGCDRADLVLGQMYVGHAKLFRVRLDHAFVVYVRLREFVLEEALVVVPGSLGRTVGQALQVFWIAYRVLTATLRCFCE